MSSTDVRPAVSPPPEASPGPMRQIPRPPRLRSTRAGRQPGRSLTIAVWAALALGALITAFPLIGEAKQFLGAMMIFWEV